MTREEAIKDIQDNILPVVGGKSLAMAISALRQPEIIRCKDCEYLCNEDGLRGMCWHINGFGTDVKDKYNSFCSWAKRREVTE